MGCNRVCTHCQWRNFYYGSGMVGYKLVPVLDTVCQSQAQPLPSASFVDSAHWQRSSPHASMHGHAVVDPLPGSDYHTNPMGHHWQPPSAVDVDSATVYDVLSTRVPTEPNIFKPDGY